MLVLLFLEFLGEKKDYAITGLYVYFLFPILRIALGCTFAIF